MVFGRAYHIKLAKVSKAFISLMLRSQDEDNINTHSKCEFSLWFF